MKKIFFLSFNKEKINRIKDLYLPTKIHSSKYDEIYILERERESEKELARISGNIKQCPYILLAN